jgi:hypothetical protein
MVPIFSVNTHIMLWLQNGAHILSKYKMVSVFSVNAHIMLWLQNGSHILSKYTHYAVITKWFPYSQSAQRGPFCLKSP